MQPGAAVPRATQPQRERPPVLAGAADGSVRVWDARDLAQPLHAFAVHVKPTMRLEWSPTHPGPRPSMPQASLFAASPKHPARGPHLAQLEAGRNRSAAYWLQVGVFDAVPDSDRVLSPCFHPSTHQFTHQKHRCELAFCRGQACWQAAATTGASASGT